MLYVHNEVSGVVISDSKEAMNEKMKELEGDVVFHEEDGSTWFFEKQDGVKPKEVLHNYYTSYEIEDLIIWLITEFDPTRDVVLLIENEEHMSYVEGLIRLARIAMQDESFYDAFDYLTGRVEFWQEKELLLDEITIYAYDNELHMIVDFDECANEEFKKTFLNAMSEKFILFEVFENG